MRCSSVAGSGPVAGGPPNPLGGWSRGARRRSRSGAGRETWARGAGPAARARALVLGGVGTAVREVQVVELPEVDEERPRLLSIGLHAHPVLLRVAFKDEVFLELRADEALVVVRSGVYEMTERLLRRPLAFRERPPTLGLRHRQHTRRRLFECAYEVIESVFSQIGRAQ